MSQNAFALQSVSSKLVRQVFAPADRKSFRSSQWKVKSSTPGYRAGLLPDMRASTAREREKRLLAVKSSSLLYHLPSVLICCKQRRPFCSILLDSYTAINHQGQTCHLSEAPAKRALSLSVKLQGGLTRRLCFFFFEKQNGSHQRRSHLLPFIFAQN